MRDFVNGVGRVLGSIGIAFVGVVVWLCIGFAWFCAYLWNERERAARLVITGISAALFGYAGTVLGTQLLFVIGDWIARVPSAAMAMRWVRW